MKLGLCLHTSPDMDVRRKALSIVMDMISNRNVEEVVLLMKKELVKTIDQEYEKSIEYRQLLVQSIHLCAIKFSQVAATVVDVLMDVVTDVDGGSAVDVIEFVKSVLL